jgi:tetratricopeptide (TPR) repeat protein
MKKTVIAFLVTGLLITGLKAQTIQEGMNHLYADRFKSATGVFEKLLATNPNNIEAIYWLGQVYFDMDDNAKARQIYQKALETNGSAPLILVGLGHADLHDNKTNDARQKFEAAITAATTKKGTDPIVLSAIGRANVDAKAGDFNYAIEKLTAAAARDEKNTEILLQLGNAHRKARPGEGGGEAFKNYKKALEIDPKFAVADIRLAKLFESQRNWDFVLEFLNDAVKRDPTFAPAYYELFYYNFYRAKFSEAEGYLNSYIKSSDAEPQHDFLLAQLSWAKKDFAGAITKAEGVVTAMGDKTKPKVYKLLADANFQKGDFGNAKKYSDKYFSKEKPEDFISFDYKLLADILSKTGGTNDEIVNAYLKGVELDTVLTSKIDFLKQGAAYFKTNKIRDKEGDLIQKIIDLKPKPSINDYFDLTLARYFTPDNARSRVVALTMIEKFPDQVYGYEWAFNNSNAVDTVKKDSIAVPDALKLYDFSKKDTAKFKKQYLTSVRFLSTYYINQAKDKEKSLEFFTKWLEVDAANAPTIQQYIEQIKKMPAKQAAPPRGNVQPTSTTEKKAVGATATKPKTTAVSKKATVKK